MDDDSGRVEDAAQPRRGRALQKVERVGDDVPWLFACGDPLAGRVDRPARGVEGELVAVLGLECDKPLVLQELVHRGQRPQRILLLHFA